MGKDWHDVYRTDGSTAIKTAGDAAWAKDPPELIIPSKDFVAEFTPPDYLIDRILQRRFIYSMTAPTGGGKTTILLRVAAHTALKLDIGDHETAKGVVLYLAGENPDDIRTRWIALSHHMQFDINAIDVNFIPGVFSIPDMMARIRREVQALRGVDLVIVDRSAAYFGGADENDNKQMGDHARMLRELTTLPGGPTVLVACHPVKNAGNDNLLPRGGGAFIAEMDGNLVCLKRDSIVDLHCQGKFRGPDFEPIGFELVTVTAPGLLDSRKRSIPSVICAPLSDKGREDIKANARKDENAIIDLMNKCPNASIKGMAEMRPSWPHSEPGGETIPRQPSG